MNDLQKKLDELTALRDTLLKLTSNFDVANIKTISGTADYVGKVQVIAKRYKDQQSAIKTIFKNATNDTKNKDKESQRLAKESRTLAKESQRLAKESRNLANESQRLAKESVINFKNTNKTSAEQSIELLKMLINNITADIDQTTKELTRLATLDKIRKQCDTDEYLKQFLTAYLTNHIIPLVNDATSIITFKIKSLCDWKYPGLQLHPISEEWINCMITADPLYLTYHTDISIYNENLSVLPEIPVTESVAKFPLEYQRRLRIYNIKDQDFSVLPQAAFGCISCHNFLNQFTLVDIEKYLIKVFELLKPGGTLVCTLNFNYVLSTVNLVKYDFFKYAVNTAIIKFFENNGYNIISTVNLSVNDWTCSILIEARKPGVLATSKAHQVLGSIITK